MTEKAILTMTMNHTLYYVKATIAQALGNMAEAISSLRQALFLEPEIVVAEFTTLVCYINQAKVPRQQNISRVHYIPQTI